MSPAHALGAARRLAAPLLLATLFLLPPPLPGVFVPAARAQSWVQLPTSGASPTARRQQGMIVDEAGNRLVIAGGEAADGRTWALDLAGAPVWADLNAPIPPEAADIVRAIYDPVGRRMILVTPSLAVYALGLASPTQWVLLASSGTGPSGRRYPTIAYDSLRNRLLLFGGGPDTGIYSDVWALNLTGPATWQQLTPAAPGPSARWAAVSVYDPAGDRFVIATGNASGLVSDVWALSLSGTPAWTQITYSGVGPSARYLSAATYDLVTHELLVFAGNTTQTEAGGVNDLWGLDLQNPVQWVLQSPPGPTPSVRWSHMLVYHAGAARLITYGGWDGTLFRGDIWTLQRSDPLAPPVIFGFLPHGGRVGDEVTIQGASFVEPLEVTFGGVSAPLVSTSLSAIRALVPPGAQTGPITVTTVHGSATTTTDFLVGELPEITDAEPDSARWGETVQLRGRHLASTTRVRFGGTGAAAFVIGSDSALTVTVDTLATSGPIHVTTLVGTNQSTFGFEIIPDDPRPRLLSVRDVAGDQGGRVMLRWRASDFDKDRYRSIVGYRVWRRAPLAGVPPGASATGVWRSGRSLGQTLANPDVFWESLAELPAAFLPGYAHAAATLQDSTELGNPYTAFFVQALTASPFVFYNSSPDSGYSVDNLAPPTPAPFAVAYGATANTLHWRGRAVPDLRGYQIHRGASDTFVPSSTTLLATVDDTTYVDMPGSHYYKLAAIDVHGNRSRFAAASPDRPVAALLAFVRAERTAGRVRMTWFSGGNAALPAEVHRRTAGTEWRMQGSILADGSGYLRFEDDDVEDGERYGYRLSVVDSDGQQLWLGEAWVDAMVTRFAWIGLAPNPSTNGRVSVALAVPAGASAALGLFDVAGRRIEALELRGGGESVSTAEFGTVARLRPGVYLIRASLGPTLLTRRIVVLD